MIGQHRALCGGIARFFAADYGVTTKAGRKRRGYVQHLFQIEVPIIMFLLDILSFNPVCTRNSAARGAG